MYTRYIEVLNLVLGYETAVRQLHREAARSGIMISLFSSLVSSLVINDLFVLISCFHTFKHSTALNLAHNFKVIAVHSQHSSGWRSMAQRQ